MFDFVRILLKIAIVKTSGYFSSYQCEVNDRVERERERVAIEIGFLKIFIANNYNFAIIG